MMESAMKRNVLQKINEVGYQKDYLSIPTPSKQLK
jgi:hypothetical protein